jgi:hypothetical protein
MLVIAVASSLALGACGGSSGHPGDATSTSRAADTPATATGATATPTVPARRVVPRTESSGVLTQVNNHYPDGKPAEQTAPTVTPGTGGLKTVFTLHLNVRSLLGPHGYARRDYEVLLAGIRPRCALWTQLDAGKLGTRADVALHPPYYLGWCAGAYHGTVLLQTNPSCPPRTSTTAPPCRMYPTRYAVVGRFTFRAR